MNAEAVDRRRIHLAGHCNSPEGAVHKRVGRLNIHHILAPEGHHMGSDCSPDQGEEDRAGGLDQGGVPRMNAGAARACSRKTYKSR